jgi:hypothetical protein
MGENTMRGVPPESEQRCPKRLVGRQDPALVLGMRPRFVGQQKPSACHRAVGGGVTHLADGLAQVGRNVKAQPIQKVH